MSFGSRAVCRVFSLALLFAAGIGSKSLHSQTPQALVLPYTISMLAGGGASSTAGSACSTGSSLKATDAYGDGCPATAALFSTDIRGGVTVDPLGNVFVADTSNNLVRKIDPRTGLITVFAGGGKVCTGTLDKNGDGCVAGSNTVFNGPRGIGSDPYGNVFIAGYGDNSVHLVCNAVSPLCMAAQVGTMRLAAGCYTTATAYPTQGNTGDGLLATGACSPSTDATLNQPRGVSADAYGNVFIADTGNSRIRVVVGPGLAGANPLLAVLQANPANSSLTLANAAGRIYALVGGPAFTAPSAAGAACSTGSTSLALDATGDGCPFYNTSLSASSGAVQGIATDSFGDAIFTDSQSTGRLRIVYAGGANNPMTQAITANNPTVAAPQVGYVYSIAGGGSTATSTSPVLGSSASVDGNIFKLAVDANKDVYISDNTAILFFDSGTGYIRKIAISGTNCSGAADAFGDGCPATQATFGGGSGSALGLGLDNLGNLYFADSNNRAIREVSATSFAPASIGSGSTPGLFVHAPAGTTAISTALSPNSDFALGTAACAANAGDLTYDCVVPVTFVPTQLGLRDAPITIQTTPASGGAVIASLTASAVGSSLTFDPAAPATPTTQALGTLLPTSVAVDGSGNTYTVDSTTSRITKITAGTSVPISTPLASLPSQIAVDARGNVYAATAGSASLTKLSLTAPATYTASTLTNTAIASASAVAVDPNGDVYVADNTTGAVLRFSQTTGIASTLTATALSSPAALAFDNLGNLLVADKGAGKVYRLPIAGVATGLPAAVAVTGSVTPVAVAADPAGDVFIADGGTQSVIEVPVSGAQATVATGFTAINGLAIDGAGNLYVSDLNIMGITEVLRNQFAFPFGLSVSTTLAGTVTNSGNSAATGFAQTDAADFQVNGTGSTCSLTATSILPGAACTLNASFTPAASGSGAVSDVLSFLPAASTLGSVTLTGTKSGNATTTTTMVGGETPANPVYVAGGASVTFSVTVAASTGVAAGNVNVTLDGGMAMSYPVNGSGVATVALTGLIAGPHTLAATYPSQSGISGSTAQALSFSVAQATTSVSWTPASFTEQYSQAIGTGVFNASANGIPGSFVYTATPSGGGTAIAVDAASYLPVGAYSLAVTFYPSDAVDYAGASGAVASFTVTKASTSAPVGASQYVVAADGSGNFSTVGAAIAALPASGGNVYIAPGTYSGQFVVSYPNVSLRGLGGNAQKVLLTAETGAYSAPYPASVSAASNGFQGDEGSSTIVVDKSTVNGASYTPNGFYAENLSVANTYDTDSTNASTVATVNGTCTAGQPPNNNQALFNAGTLCASQALALWIRSDKAVLNNVRLTSLQDTLYAGSQGCGTTCVPARQYFFGGYIAGDVDYIFGDAAVVFDRTTFFTAFHGTATGTETIEAQNKMRQTGSSGDYLSGYVLNNANLTSQAPGMTQLYFGRPYGQYSTFILLNTTVDQVNPTGWIEFSGDNNLPTSTYAEYNTLGAGGTPASIAGRENISLRPEQLTAAQAAQYAPLTFLGTPSPDVWNPADALTAGVNGFVPAATATAITFGQSITILARPQTPGGGAMPTGAYTLMDGSSVLSSGTLDATGSVYLTTSTLAAGKHSITLNYAGDANFSGSTSAAPLIITVGGTQTAVAVTTANPVYGSPVNVSVTVTQSAPTQAISGSVTLTVDNSAPLTSAVSGGAATFSLTGLSAGAHTLTAVYAGNTYNGASTASTTVTVAGASLKVTAPTVSITFGSAVPAFAPTYTGFVGTDTAATALTGAPSLTTTPPSPTAVGSYVITAAPGTLAAANYNLTFVNGLLTVGKAATTTTLASSNAMPGQGIPITLTATVASASTGGKPTGYVSFFSGTTLLSNITLTSTGTAAYTASFTTPGAATITAVYSGDGSFAASNSAGAPETTAPYGFTLTASPSTLNIGRGGTGAAIFTLTPTGGYQGTATLSCSGLPAYATCSFAPATVNFAGDNTVQSSKLTIGTTGGNGSAVARANPGRGSREVLAGLLLLPCMLLGSLANRRRRQPLVRMLLAALLLVAGGSVLGLAGCASGSPSSPAGVVMVVVNASSVNSAGTTSQQTTLTVTITQ